MENQNLKWWLLLAVATGCGATACTRTIYEPVVRSERVVDTVVRTAPDSAVLRALFECDSLGNVRLAELHDAKGRMAEMETRLEEGELQVVTRWQTRYVDRVREVHDTVTVVDVQTVVERERYVPRFFWWCFWVALAAVGVGIWRVVRRFL